MSRLRKFLSRELALSLLSGLILGFSFPPFHLSLLAFVGFVPFIVALERASNYKEVFKLSYFGFLIFNLVVIYWVGGWTREADPFMMIGGAALILGHPFFFTIPVLFYFYVRRRFGRPAIFLFPFLYLTFEYFHSITQIAFPWLTVGYSQSYNLADIQMAQYTGLFGISLQVLLVNALFSYAAIAFTQKLKLVAIASMASAALLVVIPQIYGEIILSRSAGIDYENKMRVAVVQPNIDPYAKWIGDPHEILNTYEKETLQILGKKPQLVVWPETAIPFYILLPQYSNDREALQSFIDTTGISLLTGLPLAQYFTDSSNAKPSRHFDEFLGEYYNAYNGAALFMPYLSTNQTYGKIILVPFAERIPYADEVPFLIKIIKWGVGISNWQIGQDTTVFRLRNGNTFSTVICYESIFPGFVRQFAKKGADFLVIITNDGWFGKSSGPYQHAAYAIMRAVENRRAVVRSANTGISEIIDPYGRLISGPTSLDTKASLVADVPLETDITFYSLHGDWIARLAEIISTVSILFALFLKFEERR